MGAVSARPSRSRAGRPARGISPFSSPLRGSAAVRPDTGNGVGASSIRVAVTTADAARDAIGGAEGPAKAPVGLDDGTATDHRKASSGIVEGAEGAGPRGPDRVRGPGRSRRARARLRRVGS